MKDEHTMNQSQSASFGTVSYNRQLNPLVLRKLKSLLRSLRRAHTPPIAELLRYIEITSNPRQLYKSINTLQSKLWSLPPQEQTLLRERLADILSAPILQAPERALRLEAASWLRMFTQATYLPQPEQSFVTFVTTATRTEHIDAAERATYLKMIVDCFWPFRYPYPAFTWEVFPANSIFYPLTALLAHSDEVAQSLLIAIFSELPRLDEAEIAPHLLPVALQWANHSDRERRQRICTILARLNHPEAQAALKHLQSDTDPLVQSSAHRAAEKKQRA